MSKKSKKKIATKRTQLLKESQALVPMLHTGNVQGPETRQLETVGDMRREMQRVYRMVFRGELMLDEATRLIYILQNMIQAIKTENELNTLNDAYKKAWGGVAILINQNEETDNVVDAKPIP